MGMTSDENANKKSKTDTQSKTQSQSQTSKTSTADRADKGDKDSAASKANESAKSGASRSTDGKTKQDKLAKSVNDSLSAIGRSVQDTLDSATQGLLSDAIGALTSGAQQTASATAKSFTDMTGNAKVIADKLSSLNYNETQIAGIMGRFTQESSLNPNAIRKNDNKKAAGDLRHSVGIGQWNGARKQALKDFAAAKGTNINDLETQVEFFDHELRNAPDEKRARDAILGGKTVEDVAKGMMHYERPQNYSSKNPTNGHGWANTKSYAADYASKLGVSTPASGESGLVSLGRNITDSISNTLGILSGRAVERNQEMAGVSATSTPDSVPGYRDPMVTKVDANGNPLSKEQKSQQKAATSNQQTTAAQTKTADTKQVEANSAGVSGFFSELARAISDPIGAVDSIIEERTAKNKVPDAKRTGIAGIVEDVKTQKPLSVAKKTIGAVSNPIGFMLETVIDEVTNSPEWSAPGPDGNPVTGLDRVANFFAERSKNYKNEAKTIKEKGSSGNENRILFDGTNSVSIASSKTKTKGNSLFDQLQPQIQLSLADLQVPTPTIKSS